MSENKQITLQMLEAYTRDVGRNTARIDYESMDSLGVSTGDPLSINNRTVAIVLPLYPSDEGKSVLRTDGLVRNNAGVKIGDRVEVIKKIGVPICEELHVRPLEPIPPINEVYIPDSIDGHFVTLGDNIFVPYFGGRLVFQVVKLRPEEKTVRVISKTICHIIDDGVKKKNEDRAIQIEIVEELTKIMGSLTSVLEKINRL